MKLYQGNRFPFCCAVFAEADAPEVRSVLETLDRHKIRCAIPKRRHKDCLARAAVVLLFLSPEALRDPAVLKDVAAATEADKTVLPVYLKETALTPGLSLQLGQTQGLLKYREESEEAFLQKLLNAPALKEMSVTPQQKKALRRRALGWAIGGALVLGAAVLIGLFWRPLKAMLPNAPLRKLGVSLDFDSVETLYAYGETTRDAYEMPRYRIYADGEHDWVRLGEELIPQGNIAKLDDFALLENLKELCICNNPVESLAPICTLEKLTLLDVSHDALSDFSGIGALSELQTLNIAHNALTSLDEIQTLPKLRTLDISYNEFHSLDALLSMPSLETVYIDAAMLDAANALGETPFTFVCVNTPVYFYDELVDALNDPSVTDIRIMLSMRIPEDADVTVRPGVALTGYDPNNNIRVDVLGTLRLYGVWEMGPSDRNIYGTVIVENGGLYTGGMCDTFISGTFRIEPGGRQNMERGAVFFLSGGHYENNGDVYLRDGYRLRLITGSVVNNGALRFTSSEYGVVENSIPDEQFKNNGSVYLDGLPVPDKVLPGSARN